MLISPISIFPRRRGKRFKTRVIAAQPTRNKTQNISRKGAKAAKKLNFPTWRSWRLGASKSPFWILRATGKFAQAAKTFNYSNSVRLKEPTDPYSP
jgi:hypothetical protein